VSLGEIIDSALDASGKLHLLALNHGSLNYLAQNTPDTWNSLETVVPAHVLKAAFAVAGDGAVYVIWQGDQSGSELFFQERESEGIWTGPLAISPAAFGVDIAVDSLGGVHVSYIDPLGIPEPPGASGAYQYRSPQGDWGYTMTLPAGEKSQVFLGPGDRIFMAFTHTSENSNVCSMDHPYGEFVCYAASTRARHMVMDENNFLHIITEDGLYAEFDAAGMPVSGYTLSQAQNGMLAVDSARNLYLVSAQGGYVRFRYKVSGRQWTAPVILTTWSGIGAPQIHSDPEGHLSLVFEQGPEMPVSVRSLPTAAKVTALSQVITLPEDMHKPTLSFDYILTGAIHDTDVLSATISGEGFAFSFPLSDSTTDWTPIWMDASPWAGETVTLTLAASVQELQSNLRVSLDDISLGSWLTPLPTAVTPTELTPYASAAITVTGSNFLEGAQVYVDDLLLDSTWISATEITATAPSSLTMGLHPLRIVNPGGQTGYAPQALQVGTTTYVPILLKDPPWIQ
jgi:hypothetical protein